jgi:YggT family protein
MILLADTRGEIADYISAVAGVYIILIIAAIVVQIAFDFGARVPYYRWSDAIFNFLRDVTQPYLSIFRRFIPPIGPLDISPLVAILVLSIGSRLLANAVAG